MQEILKNFGLVTQLGLSVIISILIFVLGFNYLDKYFSANGKLLILGVLLGVLCGILVAYRQVSKYLKIDKSDDRDQQ
ncbi:MAG: AtpZ/AtpI family protein [Candidatus Cloacimonetes bacterium]|nr:AtpZ/AtpI family protein [Candidatus Cloacimonadota bacterium]MCF7868277.1 AtpZ/AtpI family protein [Candidatus Cloacimonadota bacterium]